ncbi:hypothetical protein H072_1464 [Dactylellina haptotyla CBS 200.50]|uniref:Uncharacterized protein n=1 Tax=Dactylellina haptotyla (strain CBS 200.50) TaxID=1284197 RepID=S8BYH0_DACHA|nr:hypothetical protein H072_1464 [Dactylellina haptotyla CBS 200.50]
MGSESVLRRLLLVVLLVLQVSIVAAQNDPDSSLAGWSDFNCTVRRGSRIIGDPKAEGGCSTINLTNVSSVNIASLAFGCTITIYSDDFCSNDPTELRVNQCLSIGARIRSFSVDGCDPNPPTSLSTSRRPLSTSLAPSSTSSGTPTNGNPQTTGTESSSPTDTNPLDSSSDGLSKGAIAGIAVGVTIVVIVAAALLVRWFFVSRRPRTPPAAPDHSAPEEDQEKKRAFWPFGRRRNPSYASFPVPPAELGGSYPDTGEDGVPRPPMAPVYELSTPEYGELPTMRSPISPEDGYKDFPKTEEGDVVSPIINVQPPGTDMSISSAFPEKLAREDERNPESSK